MNIHFKDIELFNKLQNATIYKSVMGSHMYGTNNDKSDIDYLCIYVPSISERNSVLNSHHQLQYKDIENNIDYNFVNLFTFIKNLLNGDSVINTEIINSEKIKDSELKFLYDMRYDLVNYKIIRSYLGIARKDIREIRKQNNFEGEKRKLAHAWRGFRFAEMLLNKKFNCLISEDLKNEILDIKSIQNKKDFTDKIVLIKEIIDQKRNELNTLFNNKSLEFPNFLTVNTQNMLDHHISNLLNKNIWSVKSNWYMDMECFYITNETPEIEYD